ncbi:MAG: DUF262 domain-containing protein [Prevotella sp.]|jgi:uncharacterized protein with ParB-like and HNH nuclease domain|nr:DUF262 domain-containing protein [Prevotella sp.]
MIKITDSDFSAELNEQKRKVDFNTYDMSVKELISMVGDGLIDIAPEYQRQFRWDDDRQSVLAESIFLGIPVPSLYMATNKDGSWEVIDGVQRLSSIINFAAEIKSQARKKVNLKQPFKLTGLKKLSSFNGKLFSDLPKSIQLDFLLKPIKITTLSDKSDKAVRFDLFERLNTGGIKLSNQEIRSCIYRGQFNDFLKKMSTYKPFLKSIRLPKSMETDGTREELVLRFFAYLFNYKDFDHSVVDFLNDYMDSASKKFDYANNESLFTSVFDSLSRLSHGVIKTKSRVTTSIILFEAVAVGAALAYRKKGEINIDGFYNWVSEKEFLSLMTGATNTKSRVVKRIEHCRDRFIE